MEMLDRLPVATLTFLAGVVLLVIFAVNGTITEDQAFKDLIYLGGGAGAIGYVRNQAGKGVRR